MRELENILHGLNAIGESMRREAEACAAELQERQRLGLQGADAIKHYNEWMQRHGMEHLIVKP